MFKQTTFKQSAIGLIAILLSSSVVSGTRTVYRDDSTKIIDMAEMPRVKLWSNYRHTQSAEGYILVCNIPPPSDNKSWPYFGCVDKNKKPAWVMLETYEISGVSLKAYEIRSNGTLITYWGKKK